PLGGIAPLPCSAELYSAGLPCARRGAHAALSPYLGAPAAPVLWHAVQVVSKTALPSAGFAAAPAAGAAPAGAAAATCSGAAPAAGAEPGASCGTVSGSAGGAFAFMSFTQAA